MNINSSFELIESIHKALEIKDTENFVILLEQLIMRKKDDFDVLNEDLKNIFIIIPNLIRYEENHNNNGEILIEFLSDFIETLIRFNVDCVEFVDETFRSICEIVGLTKKSIEKLFILCSKVPKEKKQFIFSLIIGFCREKLDNVAMSILFQRQEFETEICENLKEIYEILLKILVKEKANQRIIEIKNTLINIDSLIKISKEKFKNYAAVILYNALDYLQDSNDKIKVVSLKIIYDLIEYCHEQIEEVSDKISPVFESFKDDGNEKIRELTEKILNKLVETNKRKQSKYINLDIDNDEFIENNCDVNDMDEINEKFEVINETHVNNELITQYKIKTKNIEQESGSKINHRINLSNAAAKIKEKLSLKASSEMKESNEKNKEESVNDSYRYKGKIIRNHSGRKRINIGELKQKIKELMNRERIMRENLVEYKENTAILIKQKKVRIIELEDKIKFLRNEIHNIKVKKGITDE